MSPLNLELKVNQFVEFLRSYGPTASSDSIWDEHVVSQAAAMHVHPIEVASERLNNLVANFNSEDPTTTILTGTAGDGKTWHCRHIFTALGGSSEAWEKSGPLIELKIGDRTLVIVKDLSQFQDDARLPEIMNRILPSVLGQSSAEVFLIAANDGQLLRFWRTFAEANPAARRVEEAIRVMLKGDLWEHPGLRFRLFNLSRQPHDQLFESVVEALASHPDWSKCIGCQLLPNLVCPIRRNLDLLSKPGDAGLRTRLRELIRLAADNDNHLPMRQVLLLAVNIMLGVSGRSTALMRCSTAHAMFESDELKASNPYDNALGLNLSEGVHRQYRAFQAFEAMGIGHETNNAVDSLLIEGVPKAVHDTYVRGDHLFGNGQFEAIRNLYQRGLLEDFQVFQHGLERQRRRLFFCMLPGKSDDPLDPWKLTVFTYGGDYLRFSADLAAGRSIDWVRSKLIIGLNRSYVGAMCDETQHVWLAAPAANGESRIGRVLDADIPVGRGGKFIYHFDFDSKGPHGRPRMVVRHSAGYELGSNNLSPLLFEYLMRVQGGSLPGSFSRQCFEELRHFRLRIVAELARQKIVDLDDLAELRIIRTNSDGSLRHDAIIVAGGSL